MKNPLRKRIPRELKSEIGKYLVIFLLMLGTIGMVSGFLVADGSMIKAYNESFEKYNIEDGNFRTGEKVYRGQREAMEEQGIKIYENYYIEEALTNGSTMRFFKNRDEVDKVCIMEGRLPKTTGEIAIDRMYADNNSLKIGDTLSSGDKTWKIAGLIALSDYSALFQNNNDSMFDAVKFGVSVVTPEEFDSLDQEKLQYNYSWIYDKKPKDEKEEKEVSEDLMKEMGKVVTLENFVPRYQNQAIIFTGDDMGGDKAMMVMLLYIVIAIMAFVFGITTGNTITKEAGVIGTLRASGYTGNELIRHYMTLPVLVTLAGALAGNVLGYTVFKDVCAGMYYGSYSLPTYVTVWNAEAFLMTTVVPIVIMVLVNYGILHHKMRLSPLKFLRGQGRWCPAYCRPVGAAPLLPAGQLAPLLLSGAALAAARGQAASIPPPGASARRIRPSAADAVSASVSPPVPPLPAFRVALLPARPSAFSPECVRRAFGRAASAAAFPPVGNARRPPSAGRASAAWGR